MTFNVRVSPWVESKEPTGIDFPEEMSPHKAQYRSMPLFCAAHWIASKGGSISINSADVPVWEAAYEEELLPRIAGGAIEVNGLSGGRLDNVGDKPSGSAQTLSASKFQDIKIHYPFTLSADELLDFAFSDEFNKPVLDCNPCFSDAEWKAGNGDVLRDDEGIHWKRLRVSRAAIAKLWPFRAADPLDVETHQVVQAPENIDGSPPAQDVPQPRMDDVVVQTGVPGESIGGDKSTNPSASTSGDSGNPVSPAQPSAKGAAGRKAIYRAYVKSFAGKQGPTRKEEKAHLINQHQMGAAEIRGLRKDFAPPEWKRSGVRKKPCD